jgi:hypothetical protein
MSGYIIINFACFGGRRGIRTLGTVAGTQSFQDCQFNHSCILPRRHQLLSQQAYELKTSVRSLACRLNAAPPLKIVNSQGLVYNFVFFEA